jgi:hypothetical protein
VSTQELEASWAGYLGPQTKVQSETLLKQKQMVPPLSPITPTDTSQTVEGKKFTEIGSPITTLTPLQSSFRTPGPEITFASDLTLIPLEEMPPSNFFFSMKRRAIVRRESHQKEGVVAKRKRMIFDGQGLEDSELTKEMVGSLGTFATTNQWSVENLAEQLKQRNLLISQLQNQIRTIENNIRSEVNKGLEQARANDKQEIQQLKSSLEEMQRNVQASEGWAIQQGELVKQLQAKVKLTENMVIDITVFQAQAVEICEKLELAQRSLLNKVEIIQNHFRVVNESLDNICFREREATTTRVTFQEAVVSSAREEMSIVPRLSVSEQVRGDILLKTWEANIAESKRTTKEIKEAYEEAFHSLNKESSGFGKGDISEVLGQVDVEKHQIDIKTISKETQAEISQLKQVDIAQIDRWLVKPNLQLQSMTSEDKRMEDRLPQLENKLYIF